MQQRLKKHNISDAKIFVYRFYVFVVQNVKTPLMFQYLFAFFELMQILSFSFESKSEDCWNNKSFASQMKLLFQFFRPHTFFLSGVRMLTFFYLASSGFILLYTTSSFISCIYLKNIETARKKSKFLNIVKSIFLLYIYIMYLPLLNSLFSILNCKSGKNFYVKEISCKGGTFYVTAGFSIILSLFLIIFCFFGILLCYDIFYKKIGDSRQTSTPEISIFCFKTALVIFNELTNSKKFFIYFYVVFSIVVFLIYQRYAFYYNKERRKINNFFSRILFWHSLSLLFSYLLKGWNFNCGYILTLSSIIIGILEIKLYPRKPCDFVADAPVIHPIEAYITIGRLLDLIEEATNNNRCSIIGLGAYISSFEKNCIISNCSLKKIAMNPFDEKFQSTLYPTLVQHIDQRYKFVMEKFPECTGLKIMYSYFIYSYLNKPALAQSLVAGLKNYRMSIIEEFLYFRMLCIVEQEYSYLSTQNDSLTFLRLFTQLKENIIKISSLYVNFWNSLLISHQSSDDGLSYLNDCGAEISEIKKTIDDCYRELEKIKPNDLKIMSCYAEYLEDIIDDYTRSRVIKKKIEEIKSQEQDFGTSKQQFSTDLQHISQTDKVKYIVVSSSEHDFGNIIDVSLSFCVNSGYTKTELVGKNYKMLLPDIFRKPHDELLISKIGDIEKLRLKKEKKEEMKKPMKTFTSFFLLKSRYIKPATFSPFIVTNELDKTFFITKIAIGEPESDKRKVEACYILTDPKLTMLNYTINCNKALAMNDIDEVQKNNYNISHFIVKQNQAKDVIQWSKKSKSVNINTEFLFSHNPININGNFIGYFFKLTPLQYPLAIPSLKKEKKSFSVTKDFVPEFKNDLIFVFNNKSQDYCQKKFKEEDERELIQELKEKAIGKLRSEKKKNTADTSESDLSQSCESNETHSSNSDSDSDSDSEPSSLHPEELNINLNSENNSSSQPDSFIGGNTEVNDEEKQEEKKEEKPFVASKYDIMKVHRNEMYQVNTKKIKLFVYNYKKQQVELVPQSISAVTQIETQYNNLKDSELYKTKEVSKHMSSSSKQIKKESTFEINEKENQNEKMLKKIRYAMEKYEAGAAILRLQLIGLFTFSVLLCEGIITYSLFMNVSNKLEETSSHVKDSYRLLMNSILGIFYSRELTLLGNSEYDVTYKDMDVYFKDTLSNIAEVCSETQRLTDNLITSNFKASKENQDSLDQGVTVFMITDDLLVKTFDLEPNAITSQTTSALFTVSKLEKSQVIPTNKAVYFAITNGLNPIIIILLSQVDVMAKEYVNINQKNLSLFIYVMLVYVCFGLSSFFILSHSHFQVENKKEDYLAVFEEIKIYSIVSSLQRCLSLNQKYSIKKEDETNTLLQDSSESEEMSSTNLPKAVSVKKKESKEENTSQQKKKKITTSYIKKKGVIFCTMLFSSFLSVIIYFISANRFGVLDKEMYVYKNSSLMYLKYLNMFNLVREYIFDQSSKVRYKSVGDYLQAQFEEVYSFNKEVKQIFEENFNKLSKDYLNLFQIIYFSDLCEYTGDFMQNMTIDLNCTQITDGASTFVRNYF